MKTWIKVQSDGLVINRIRQEETPANCELGNWMLLPHPFVNPGWKVLPNGNLIRPESFGFPIITKEAFFNRLTESEKMLLIEKSNTNSEVAATNNYLNSLEVVSLYTAQIGLVITTLVDNNIIEKVRIPEIMKLSTESEEPQFFMPSLPSSMEAP